MEERRLGLRGQVDLPAIQYVDGFAHECRVVDISPRGLVLERTPRLANREPQTMSFVELRTDEGRMVRCLARSVWTRGQLQAMRYVAGIAPVAQLEIAEMLDRAHARGVTLH